jgi:hypothetical protein
MEGSLKESNYGDFSSKEFSASRRRVSLSFFPFFLLETKKSNEKQCMAGQYKRGDVLLVLAMCPYA